MNVKLNKLEARLAEYIGKARYSMNRATGTADQKVGPQSAEFTDVNSAGGEIAFCKAFNLYPDLQFDERPDFDATLPSGARVDVKTTHRERGRLLVVPWKARKPCDLYVLVIGELPEYRIAGGLACDQLLTEDRLGDLGHGSTYIADQSDLWDISELDWRYSYGEKQCLTK